MIEIQQLVKRFGAKTALDGISLRVEQGSVFGLVGSNGAGKSTLLRTIAGVFRTDGGSVQIDGQPVFENSQMKNRVYFVPDYPYFLPKATLEEMAVFHRRVYTRWSEESYRTLCKTFSLDPKGRLQNFSKGMQRQAALILALSCQPDYLLLDEIFDGLDPVVRQLLKKLLAGQVDERKMTVVIASHNLRELEDVCDHVGIMDHGKVLLERSLAQLQDNMVKLQVVFPDGVTEVPADLPVLHASRIGRIHTLIMRMNAQEAEDLLAAYSPLLVDAVPLTLEEIFIYELGGADYAVKDIVL